MVNRFLVHDANVEAKATKPPPRYTEGTLIQAMKTISTLVENPALKQLLKESSGLGTEATRAGIIATLLKLGFISRKQQALMSSGNARALIDSLPEPVKDFATTAVWEQVLEDIAQGKRDADDFVQQQSAVVTRLIAELMHQLSELSAPPVQTPGKACPECQEGQMLRKQARQGAGKGRYFLACNRYPECRYTEPCN